MARHIDLGRRGERLAEEYLTQAGHRVVDRNWRSPRGELDLVTIDREQVVAVEVKTRTSLDFGHPFEAIDRRKLERVYRLGWDWCSAHGMASSRLRVDAIAVITGRAGQRPLIEHLEGVN